MFMAVGTRSAQVACLVTAHSPPPDSPSGAAGTTQPAPLVAAMRLASRENGKD